MIAKRNVACSTKQKSRYSNKRVIRSQVLRDKTFSSKRLIKHEKYVKSDNDLDFGHSMLKDSLLVTLLYSI